MNYNYLEPEVRNTLNPTLQLLVGPIASGKSTYSKFAATKYCIICNDDAVVNTVHGGNYELYNSLYKPLYKTIENTIVTMGLGNNNDVVVDRGTNNKIASCRRFIGLAKSLDKEVVALVFPREESSTHAKRRFESDSRGLSLAYWTAVAERHEKDYQEPTLAEGFDSVIYLKWEDIKAGVVY